MNKFVQLAGMELENKMTMPRTWHEFCLQLAEQEWESDFPLMRRNHSSALRKNLGALLSFPVEEQLSVLRALVSRRFPDMRSDQKLLADEFQFRRFSLSLEWLRNNVVPSYPGLAQTNPKLRDTLDASHRALRKTATKADFQKRLLPLLRDCYEKLPPRSLTVFETVTEALPWRIKTQFDLGGLYHFRVDFILQRVAEDMSAISFSPGSLLGLGELGWDEVWPEDMDRAADDAVSLCVEIRCLVLKTYGRE